MMTRIILALATAVFLPMVLGAYLGISFLVYGGVGIFMTYVYSALLDLLEINRKKYLKI